MWNIPPKAGGCPYRVRTELTVRQVSSTCSRKKAEGKKKMTPILKLGDHDEEKEIEFELSSLLSLILQERF